MSKYSFMKQDNMNQTIIETDGRSLENIRAEFTKQLQNAVNGLPVNEDAFEMKQDPYQMQQEQYQMQQHQNQMAQNQYQMYQNQYQMQQNQYQMQQNINQMQLNRQYQMQQVPLQMKQAGIDPTYHVPYGMAQAENAVRVKQEIDKNNNLNRTPGL